jgi:hypothetical protein
LTDDVDPPFVPVAAVPTTLPDPALLKQSSIFQNPFFVSGDGQKERANGTKPGPSFQL